MSGPRVTSGEDSKQDYGTPRELIEAVEARFGKVLFDLAAHRMNKKHERYFAPERFVETVTLSTADEVDDLERSLVARGATPADAAKACAPLTMTLTGPDKTGRKKFDLSVPNSDPHAYGMNAFAHNWSDVWKKSSFADNHNKSGVLWLNPEFGDVPPWAERCALEAEKGARITMITPAMVGSNWARDICFRYADVYFLNGRVSFDGKNVYPKDCMISFFRPPTACGSSREVAVWNWKKDVIHDLWTSTNMNPNRALPSEVFQFKSSLVTIL